jgi:NAD(P)-dependent dehydrogenase (short-subunit alcohol dehydrogenase family)
MAFEERIVPDRFAGRTVIVTGAASGIGRATALRIAREGGRVIAVDRNLEGIDALLAANGGLDLVAAPGDVGTQADVDRTVALAGDRIDALVNNAGIMDRFAPLHELDDATWERVYHVYVDGVMRMSRAVLPKMLAAGKGSIVNITSEAGLRGSAAGVAYTSSKHAVIGITRASSVIYAPQGVRVNAVAPGGVRTGIVAEWASQMAQLRLGPLMQANVGGIAEPEELAAAIAWLASDDSPNVSGVVLPSDGGWSAI